MTATVPPPCTSAQRYRILALCRQIGLNRAERYELALAVLGVEIKSFDDLWETGANRLMAGLAGWQAIRQIACGNDGRTEMGEPVLDGGDGARPDWASLPCSSDQRRKIMGMCRELEFDREQRHEFASGVLGRPIETFGGLDALSACWLIDALNGFHAVEWLVSHPRPAA